MRRRGGPAVAVFVRSPHAHARIRSIDVAAARAAPGVLGVLTGADLEAAGIGPCLPGSDQAPDGTTDDDPAAPASANGRVRHVGDPVRCVVATSPGGARDAAEAVEIEYEPLPAMATRSRPCKPGAPAVWDDAPGNVALDWEAGDGGGRPAFAKAARCQRSTSSTTAWSPTRWSRAAASPSTTRRPAATRSAPAARACTACRASSPKMS